MTEPITRGILTHDQTFFIQQQVKREGFETNPLQIEYLSLLLFSIHERRIHYQNGEWRCAPAS